MLTRRRLKCNNMIYSNFREDFRYFFAFRNEQNDQFNFAFFIWFFRILKKFIQIFRRKNMFDSILFFHAETICAIEIRR